MKRINLGILIIAPLFLGLGYLFRLMIGAEGPANHFWLIIGGFAYFTCLCGLLTEEKEGDHGLNWWKGILYGISLMALYTAFITGSVIILHAAEGTAMLMIFQTVFLSATAVYLAGYALLWTRYEVAEDTIVILDGKVLYPGTKFRLWPWFRYEVKKIDRQIKIPSTEMTLTFSDGLFTVAVRDVVAHLEIDGAERDGIASLDRGKLLTDVEQWVYDCIRDQAEWQPTLGSFLHAQLGSRAIELQGIVVWWKGEAKVAVVA